MTGRNFKVLIRFGHRRPRIALVIGATAFAWLLAELLVYFGGSDWKAIERMLGYQNADRGSHIAVDDPEWVYRLNPGVTRTPMYTVTINELAFRDSPRNPKKKPGVFRIICLGGSNVYGLGLEDHQTWPAQLEKYLNENYTGRYEIWNGGACAYVSSQMAMAGREAIEKYDPDLILFGLSNGGGRTFMSEVPTRSYFKKYPQIWKELFTGDCLDRPEWIPYDARLAFVRFSPIARLFAANYLQTKKSCLWYTNLSHERKNIEAAREFFRFALNRGVTPVVFLYPGALRMIGNYTPYFKGTDLPVVKLDATGMPKDYWDVHPSALVTLWYAENIAYELENLRFIERAGNPNQKETK